MTEQPIKEPKLHVMSSEDLEAFKEELIAKKVALTKLSVLGSLLKDAAKPLRRSHDMDILAPKFNALRHMAELLQIHILECIGRTERIIEEQEKHA